MALINPAEVPSGKPGDTWLGERGDPGGTGPRGHATSSTTAAGPAKGPAMRRRPAPRSAFDNRRGLLLTSEQLAGPAATTYLLRSPYVYARQSLL